MIDFIEGEIAETGASHVVIKSGGVGFLLQISLHTFTIIKDLKNVKLLSHLIVKEDGFTLFGFAEEQERNLFRHLISVSGVGASTARMILSALNPSEAHTAIVQSQVGVLQKVKGIGEKTAQRIIVDLKEKLSKEYNTSDIKLFPESANRQEALTALVMLGFPKNHVEKALDKIIKTEGNSISVETMVKNALKIL